MPPRRRSTLYWRLSCLAILGAVAAGCGGTDGGAPATDSRDAGRAHPSPAAAAPASGGRRESSARRRRSRPSRGAWRIVNGPIAVRFDDVGPAAPSYEVHFRLSRPLSERGRGLHVELEGHTQTAFTGRGWDEASGTCYSKYVSVSDRAPRALRNAGPGDRLRLVVRVRQRPRTTLRARASVQLARPGEVRGEGGREVWLKLLGCG